MKRSHNVPVQAELFSSAPVLVVLTALQCNRDEIVELLSKVLWEVACAADDLPIEE
jgi:hypothetical protein